MCVCLFKKYFFKRKEDREKKNENSWCDYQRQRTINRKLCVCAGWVNAPDGNTLYSALRINCLASMHSIYYIHVYCEFALSSPEGMKTKKRQRKKKENENDKKKISHYVYTQGCYNERNCLLRHLFIRFITLLSYNLSQLLNLI